MYVLSNDFLLVLVSENVKLWSKAKNRRKNNSFTFIHQNDLFGHLHTMHWID